MSKFWTDFTFGLAFGMGLAIAIGLLRLIVLAVNMLVGHSNLTIKRVVIDFLEWFSIQPAKYKIYIAGNHELSYQKDPGFKYQMIGQFPGVKYLESKGVTIDGVKFYGSPYTPMFYDWAFMLDRGESIAQEWENIPDDTNVLITHGPGFGSQSGTAPSGVVNG